MLYPGANNEVFRRNYDGFRHAMAAAGYAEDRNLVFDVRYGDGHALDPLAVELLARRPDIVLAIARPGVIAAQRATAVTPIIAIDLESDPVASRFVESLARPAGNVTGIFMDLPQLAGKWLELLTLLAQNLTRVAVLWDPTTGPAQLEAARRAAANFKLALHEVEVRSTAEIDAAFRTAMRRHPGGMIALTSPIVNSGRRMIAEVAARERLPTLVPFPGYARDGGLIAYGPDVKTMFQHAAEFALKIAAGAPPARLPVQRPTRFALSVNLRTAAVLGIMVPQAILLRAEEVVE